MQLNQFAYAITIDKLSTADQFLTANSGVMPINNQLVNDSTDTILGGSRDLLIESTGIAGTVSVEILTTNKLFVIDLGQGESSKVSVIYDGDNIPGLTNPAGLGGVNLLADNSDAFVFKINGFDFANQNPGVLKLKVYDASDISGNTWSEGSLLLNQNVNYGVDPELSLNLDFNNLTTFGPNGSANLTNVGAIEIVFDLSNTPAADSSFTFFGTNGDCSHVPDINNNLVIYDDCGVCGGRSDTCLDCYGEPNGENVEGSFCMTSKKGECKLGKLNSNCICTSVNSPKKEVCDRLDNNCNGKVDETKDRCGVCNGNGKSCLDCVPTNSYRIQKLIDNGAKKQEQLIKQISLLLLKHNNSKRMQRLLNNVQKEAGSLSFNNWKTSWQLPTNSNFCSNSFCTTKSNGLLIASYKKNNTRLYSLTKYLNRLVKKEKLKKLNKKVSVIVTQAKRQHLQNKINVSKIPVNYSICD